MRPWETLLAVCLVFNAVSGFVYRVYRLRLGGPKADVTGQAILGALLLVLATGVWQEWGWARWATLAYGLLFAVVVMPLWTLAVFIPMRPRALDKAFAVTYWLSLAVIVVAALLL